MERDIEGQSNVIKKRKETEKRIAVLEDRVDYATKSCNEQLKKNKELKLRIQGLMLERSTHDALCKELEDKMSKRRRDLSRLVSRLSRTYEQREAAEARFVIVSHLGKENVILSTKILWNIRFRLNHLTQLETDDSHSAAAEIQHLRRFLTQQQRLEKFLGQKAAIRTPESVEETAPSTQKKHSLPCITTEQAIFTEEIANLYETVLAKLTKLCGEKLKKDRSSTNIVVDVVEFIGKREKQNLALYAYINELQAHASELYGQIRAIQKSVSGLRSSLGIPSRTAYAYVGEEDSSSSQDLPSIQLKISDELDLDEDSENARFLETTSIFEEVATKVKAMKDLLGSRDTTLGRILADESDTERKGRQVDPSENPKEHKAVKTFLKQVKTTMVTERNINHHVIIINQKASRILNFRIQTKHSSSSSAGKKEPILSGLRRRVYAPPEVREEDMLTDAKSDSPVISSSGSDSSAPSRARSPAVGAKKKKITGKKKTSKSRKSKK